MELVRRVGAAAERRRKAVESGEVDDPADYADKDAEAAALEPGSLPSEMDLQAELERIRTQLAEMDAARTQTRARAERTKDKQTVLEEALSARKEELKKAEAGGGDALARHARGLSSTLGSTVAGGRGSRTGSAASGK